MRLATIMRRLPVGLLILASGCGAPEDLDDLDVADGTTDPASDSEATPGSTDDWGQVPDAEDDDGGAGGTTGDAPPDDGDDDGSGSTGAPPADDCAPFHMTTDFAEPGPFEVERSLEGPNCSIFRPAVLGEQGPHPVIVWGNGTGAVPLIYDALLSHWASHGFVVAAANTPLSGSGIQMTACLDYIEAQASTSDSVFEGMLALDRIGAAGHSQGGGGTLVVGQDERVTTTAPVQPFTFPLFGGYNPLSQLNQQGPMFLMSGTLDVIAPRIPYQLAVWETANVPVFWGTKSGVSHIVDVIGDMGAFRREITAWMRYQLMCDDEAASLFVGDCSLCSDPDWSIESTLQP